jgi:hypothetical protein
MTTVNTDEIDRALAGAGEVEPSREFVARVMERISAEATSPPIPFPWQRAWPFAAALTWLIVGRPAPEAAVSDGLLAALTGLQGGTAGRLAVALMLAAASTAVPIRLTRRD